MSWVSKASIFPSSSTRILSADCTLEIRWAMMIWWFRESVSQTPPGYWRPWRFHSAGGVVQDQHLRLFQKRPGNTQPLLLTSGNIGAAPLDPGIVFVRHPLNKFIGAGCLASFDTFLIGGVRISPAQIVQGCFRKTGCFSAVPRKPDFSAPPWSYFRTSTPPTQTDPSSTSYRRQIRFTRLLFPEPVPPMTPMVSPLLI